MENLQQKDLGGTQENTMVEAFAMEVEVCVSQGRGGD